MADTVKEIDGRTWHTPLTDYARTSVGGARLVRRNYQGIYHYEGTQGHEFYRTKHRLKVTALQRRNPSGVWKTWMVDDPLHWHGMEEAVSDLPAGRIVVAGLGLGLMLHHAFVQRRFTRLTVVDIDKDVIDLIRPTLPDDRRVEIVCGNFYDHIKGSKDYDGILWDLAVGKQHETFGAMVYAQVQCEVELPGVPLVMFGRRREADREARCAQA
jgi:spermidine synthase